MTKVVETFKSRNHYGEIVEIPIKRTVSLEGFTFYLHRSLNDAGFWDWSEKRTGASMGFCTLYRDAQAQLERRVEHYMGYDEDDSRYFPNIILAWETRYGVLNP